MPENQNSTNKETPKKNNKATIIIALLSIVIIIQGVKIYLDHQKIDQQSDVIAVTEEELATTLQMLTDVGQELDERIEEIRKLGGDVEELERAKADLEAEKTQLERTGRANRRVISDLKEKVEGYEVLLKQKDEELVNLRAINEELMTETTNLKTERIQLSDSLRSSAKEREKLASKVAVASRLKAEDIRLYAVNNRGKEREGPEFRKRQIEQLKIVFNIAENNVAPIEGKEILIRVIDELGQVLFDVSRGSGTFILGGREEFYTASQEILYDNTRQEISFTYDKGSEYASGQYRMEVYTDDYMMGSADFIVK